ncbi:hypothetical protein [Filimonas effusa]|uniref:Uncharacterized protein n=1 Tax=Filimonas effusa TaxID=2508721 RepID=A0A4Q1DAL5_9BACT|nr:hypothetical protein [Filimonas effusa]RXK86452.1 hypothetical protein ESB13_06495 [Filimonas effusa]
MTKEYKTYRLLVIIYVILIANNALLFTGGAAYYIWFLTSVIALATVLFKERHTVLDFTKNSSDYKPSKALMFATAFIITYPRHYEAARHLNHTHVMLLQATNFLLFIAAFGVEKKDAA